MSSPGDRDHVMRFIHEADLGIRYVQQKLPEAGMIDRLLPLLRELAEEEGVVQVVEDDLDDGLRAAFTQLKFAHEGEDGQAIELDVDDESLGTLVWLGLIGPVLDALRHGSVLLVDELDASLHPDLVELLVGLFQDSRTNPHNAQLVFNAFDLGLLAETADRRLGRDQVWFTEKLHDGATRLYPLADFSPRKHENIAKGYREGRYGAVPIVSRQGFAAVADLVTSSAAS